MWKQDFNVFCKDKMKKVFIIKKNNKGTALFFVQKIQQIQVLRAKIVLSYNLAKTWYTAVKTRF